MSGWGRWVWKCRPTPTLSVVVCARMGSGGESAVVDGLAKSKDGTIGAGPVPRRRLASLAVGSVLPLSGQVCAAAKQLANFRTYTKDMRRSAANRRDNVERQFVHLYEEHAPAVMAYALRRATFEGAQEIVAETFVIAWRRIHDIPSDAALPWLYGVARKVHGNRLRADRRQQHLLRRIQTEPSEAIAWGAGDNSSSLMLALASLRPSDREVLMLTAWEGLTTQEAAVVLNCSSQAVRLRLFRARRKLRARLAHVDSDDRLHRPTMESTWTEESM